MANNIILFKQEIKTLTKIKESLSYSQRLNGSQVLLGETNQKILKSATQLLSKAINQLTEIK